MDAFTGVAEAGSPNLVAMAPGVSGALITTVIALCVAIPAMFGYNFLVTSIRGIIVEMDNFAASSHLSLSTNMLITARGNPRFEDHEYPSFVDRWALRVGRSRFLQMF